MCISSITYAELEYGVSKSSNKEKNALALLTVLSGIKVLPLGESVGTVYGSIRASLELGNRAVEMIGCVKGDVEGSLKVDPQLSFLVYLIKSVMIDNAFMRCLLRLDSSIGDLFE